MEGWARYTHFVEDTDAEQALEEGGKYSGVHTSYMAEHSMEEDTSNPMEVADMERAEGGDRGRQGVRGEATNREPVRGRGQGGAGDGWVDAEDNVQGEAEVGNDRTRQVGSNRLEGDHMFHIGSGEVGVHM